MRASTELDNIVDAGTNFRTDLDGKDGHIHAGVTGDFRYFDTVFKVRKEYYSGVINIQPVSKGLLLKDITRIRNITQDTCSSYGKNPKSTILHDVSMSSILPKSKKDNREVPTEAEAKPESRPFATEKGTEAGLVWDQYEEKRLRPETADRINTIAQELGVRVRFVDSVRGGRANASIEGIGMDYAGVLDEATANCAGRLLQDGRVLEEFIHKHRTDRSMLEKLLEAIRGLISKLTGEEKRKAQTAEDKLLAAMEEGRRQAKTNGGLKNVGGKTPSFSLKQIQPTETGLFFKKSEKHTAKRFRQSIAFAFKRYTFH